MTQQHNEILLTEDGSHTIKNVVLDECYHSSHGARQESEWVFVNAGLRECAKHEIAILEIGFGTGLNALLAMDYAQKNSEKITYTSFELYPLPYATAAQLNFCHGDLLHLQSEFDIMHQCPWNEWQAINANFSLLKMHADFSINALIAQYDVVFFDAFSPDKQPELWSDAIFAKLYLACNTDAILTTYCAKGYVRRAMQKAGFVVERIPGPPGKREMLRAKKIIQQ